MGNDIGHLVNKTRAFRTNVLDALEDVTATQDTIDSQWIGKIHIFRTKVLTTLVAKPLYLCLHGTGSAAVSFLSCLQDLASIGKHGIAIDLPGYGISHTSLSSSDTIYTVLKALGFQEHPIHIIAHSLGCVTACTYVSDYAHANICAITLVSPPGLLSFRNSLWLFLIAHGIPEYYITFSWAWPCFFLVCAYAHVTQNKELYFWCLYWICVERRQSYKKIASHVTYDKNTYEWSHDIVQNLPQDLYTKLCETHSIKVIHGKYDPILSLPKKITHKIPIIIVDSCHNPLEEWDVRNIIFG